MPRRSLPRATALLVAAALAAACGEEMPQSPADGPQAGHGLAAPSFTITEEARDSAFAQAESGSDAEADDEAGLDAALQAVGGVQIFEGDRAVVTVASASTARGEQVAVRGVIDALLFPCVGGCGTSESDNVGATTTIGPAPEDGTLQFILPLAAGGTGESQVLGSYPSYTIQMDDGLFDSDFDDVVLSVEIQPAEDECPSDSFFDDSGVRDALETLVEQSDFGADVRERREQLAFITETEDGFAVEVRENEADEPCTVAADAVPPENAVGWIHTHPFEDGERIPAGVCEKFPDGGVYGRGASSRDIDLGAFINQELGESVPGILVDRDGTLRLEFEDDPELGPRVTDVENFPACITENGS